MIYLTGTDGWLIGDCPWVILMPVMKLTGPDDDATSGLASTFLILLTRVQSGSLPSSSSVTRMMDSSSSYRDIDID